MLVLSEEWTNFKSGGEKLSGGGKAVRSDPAEREPRPCPHAVGKIDHWNIWLHTLFHI